MTAPGRFLLLGSGEFEPWSGEAERFALLGASGDGSAVVLATASGREGQAVFDRWTDMGLAHYASLDIPAVAVRVRNRADALAPGVADPIDSAGMVFFSGGNPGYLAATIAGTPVWDAITRLVGRGGVFAGCSAGAMVAGAAGAGERSGRLPFPFASGLGLMPDTAFGVHWDALSGWWIRWLRDLAPRRLPGTVTFVGIAEHTAIATDGDLWRVFGSGIVEVRAHGRRTSFAAGQTFPR
jgi:cyanophycinase